VRLLVIEDSAPTRDLLRRALEEEGHAVTTASRVSSGVRLATSETFDVLIVDVMLPDGSGLDLTRTLRAQGVRTPILFLTARGQVHDRVAGLEAGGDDYLAKPFALAELRARVHALGRRHGAAGPVRLVRGGVRVDFSARHLERDGVAIPLTAREWRVLEVLAARAGRMVTRQEILEQAWPDQPPSASDSLDVIVSRLRRKLGGASDWIRTVRGEGYVLEPSP
jgi:two-component system, OmpR family, response regulator